MNGGGLRFDRRSGGGRRKACGPGFLFKEKVERRSGNDQRAGNERRKMNMGETKRQSYTFTVREYGDGTPYIACVPVGREWSVFGKGSLSFVLPMGTTLKIAKKAGAFLNKNIDLISFTETLGPDKYSRRRA